MTTANNPVVTAEMVEAGHDAEDRWNIAATGPAGRMETIYLAMTQASPPHDEMVEQLKTQVDSIIFRASTGDAMSYEQRQQQARQAIDAALQSIGPLTGWQPIETAPKDGTRVLIYTSVGNPSTYDGVHIAEWAYEERGEERWFIPAEAGFSIDPSHWMPLPKAPALKRIEGQG